MHTFSPLSLGEKLRYIRNAKELSQENIAHDVGTTKQQISRIENGQVECSPKMLVAIKQALGIEQAPLLKHELEIYRNRLLTWIDATNANRMHEARNMRDTLSPLLDLPFEQELYMMYLMIETPLLFSDFDIATAEKNLKTVEESLADAGDIVQCLYYRNMGFYLYQQFDYKNALKYMLKAIDKDIEGLSHNSLHLLQIGTCYYDIGKPLQAITYNERAKDLIDRDRANPARAYVNGELALCHLAIGMKTKAKELIDTAIAQMESIDCSQETKVKILLTAGYVNANIDDALEGLKTTERAMELVRDDSPFSQHMRPYTLMTKAYCLLAMKSYTECQGTIDQAKKLLTHDETAMISLEAMQHCMTLKDTTSTDYIENIAIPHFVSVGLVYDALKYCDILETHYTKTSATRKAMRVVNMARDIYKDVIFGEDI